MQVLVPTAQRHPFCHILHRRQLHNSRHASLRRVQGEPLFEDGKLP